MWQSIAGAESKHPETGVLRSRHLSTSQVCNADSPGLGEISVGLEFLSLVLSLAESQAEGCCDSQADPGNSRPDPDTKYFLARLYFQEGHGHPGKESILSGSC